MKKRLNPSCQCGFIDEDLLHFIFACPRWSNQRVQLFSDLNTSPFFVTLNTLLSEDRGRTALLQFIAASGRFTYNQG